MAAPPFPVPEPRVGRRRFLSAGALGALFAGVPGGAALARAREDFDEALEGAPAAPQADPSEIRALYDLAPGLSYWNHASIGTMPRAVREAFAAYTRTCEENPWLHVWSDAWAAALDEMRAQAAAFLGAEARDLALIQNTTEAFNLLAQGLALEAGDEVLFSDLNHVGASRAFQAFGPRRGYLARRFALPVLEVPRLGPGELVALHTDAIRDNTRLLVLPHVDNVVGLRLPVAQIAAAAREKGVRWIAVDGAQVPGAQAVDVPALDVDFYATSTHKWLQSPKGLGLFWAREAAREDLLPFRVTWGQATWAGSARRYEDVGTRDPARLMALGDALAFQARVDPEARATALRDLRARALERTRAGKSLSWRSPQDVDRAGPLYAVGVEGADPAALARALFEEDRVVVRPFATLGLSALRFSPNLESSPADLDAGFDALERRL